MKRFFAGVLAALSLLAGMPAHAADKPLVIESGQTRQLPANTGLQLQGATTSNESLNIPAGAPPATPSDGMIWATTSGLYSRYGGVTLGPFSNGTVTSVTCGSPFTGGTFSAAGTCGLATNGLALSYLAQIGGNSILGNTSSTTGNVQAYVLPTSCTGSNQALSYTAGSGFVCRTISGASGCANPCYIGLPDVQSGVGAPSASSDPVGSLYLRTDSAQLWQQFNATGTVPALVQTQAFAGNSGTFSATPAAGDLLVAVCYAGFSSTPAAGTGWTIGNLFAGGGTSPNAGVSVKYAVAGESTTETPCGNSFGGVLYEVSGVPTFAASLETVNYGKNSPSTTLTYTTLNANDLVLGAFGAGGFGAATMSISGLSSGVTSVSSGSGSGMGAIGAAQAYASSGSSVSFTGTETGASGWVVGAAVVLKPGTPGWRRVGTISSVYNAGTDISDSPLTLQCSTGITCTASPNVNGDDITITASGSTGANPTATASDTAVNGTATTFMRSDAAPAIQKASSSQFGLVKVDGTTITAASGVISGTGPTISGTPTTGDCVKWASATALGDAGAVCGSGGGGSPGGSSGQVQYNNSGAFGGFTLGGDGTLNTSTGALTITKTNGSSFGSLATQNAPTGSTQCLQVNSSGTVSGTGAGCGSSSGAAISGTPTAGNCAKWASSTALADAGAACGSGGGGSLSAEYVGFSNPSVISAGTASQSAGYYRSFRLQMPYPVAIADVSILVSTANAATAVTPAIYSDNNGVPGTLLASGSTVTSVTAGMNDLPLSATYNATAGQFLWVGFIVQTSTVTQLTTGPNATEAYWTTASSTPVATAPAASTASTSFAPMVVKGPRS